MECNFSTTVDSSDYETDGLCEDTALSRHQSPEFEEIAVARDKDDWRKHANDISFYKGRMSPEYGCVAVAIPECLPERLETIGYITEPPFLYDELVDRVDSVDRVKGAQDRSRILDVFHQDTRSCYKVERQAKSTKDSTEVNGIHSENAVNGKGYAAVNGQSYSAANGDSNVSANGKQSNTANVQSYANGAINGEAAIKGKITSTIHGVSRKQNSVASGQYNGNTIINGEGAKRHNDTSAALAVDGKKSSIVNRQSNGNCVVNVGKTNDKLDACGDYDSEEGSTSHVKPHAEPDLCHMSLDDVLLVHDLPALGMEVIQAPLIYIESLPSKGVRDKVIDALNIWMHVPSEPLQTIKKTINTLHTLSLMLDDFEDGSNLRRGKPATHTIFGPAQTVNTANFQIIRALQEVEKLNDATCQRVFSEGLVELFVGQSVELNWTCNMICPSVGEYVKMVDSKTGGLFRMLARMMTALSPLRSRPSIDKLAILLGRYFQIRDDYQNLTSAEYSAQKGFAEDLDEGKYSLTMIHALKNLPQQETMLLRNILTQRRLRGHAPSAEHKMLILDMITTSGSLEFTLRALRTLMGEIESEIKRIEELSGDNLHLAKLIVMLTV